MTIPAMWLSRRGVNTDALARTLTERDRATTSSARKELTAKLLLMMSRIPSRENYNQVMRRARYKPLVLFALRRGADPRVALTGPNVPAWKLDLVMATMTRGELREFRDAIDKAIYGVIPQEYKALHHAQRSATRALEL